MIAYSTRMGITSIPASSYLGVATVFKLFANNFFTTIDCFFRGMVADSTYPGASLNALPAGSTVFHRSNYTRIENQKYSWGFIPNVCGETVSIRTHPFPDGLGRVFTRNTETVLTAEEMRSLAYTLLAAANSIDGRHKGERRKASRKRVPDFTA